MKVDITAALNEHFKYDILGIPGFRNNKLKTAGMIRTSQFLEDQGEHFEFVATHEAEAHKKEILEYYPVFKEIMDMFYLPLPGRILADNIYSAAFIYPEFTFIVAPIKEAAENGT